MSQSITVIIPAYNAEVYICEALESVIAQTRPPEQIIVVNDGSNDRTADLIYEWKQNNAVPLQLLCQKNQGVSAARNAGIRSAEGDLIAFLDADDLFLSNHLELLEQAFRRHPHIILCFADAQHFSERGIVKPSILAETKINTVAYENQAAKLRLMYNSAYMSLLPGSYILPSSTLCSKRALEQVGLFDETIKNAEDRELWLRLSRIGTFAYYPFILTQKRIHAKNLSHTQHPVPFQYYQFRVLQKMLENAENLHLTAEELQYTYRVRAHHVQSLLYTASLYGPRLYIKACFYFIQRGIFSSVWNPKHFLRALVHYRHAAPAEDLWPPRDL